MLDANFKYTTLLLLTIGNTLASLNIDWWKHAILYEIYLPSFKDSNGDGIGDLNGVNQKLDYLDDLGITIVYLTPFYPSPMIDNGYDISNYTDVDPVFGSMDDFDVLMKGMKKRRLKLVIDLVINHSSDEHPWFEKSINRIYPYTDFYVWVDPKGFDTEGKPIPPNNWMSLFEGSAWEWNDKRRQFYLHQFAIKQPDFNLRNVELKKEIKKILKFWMDRDVVGFRLDATWNYMEDKYLRDEPLLDPKNPVVKKRRDLIHIYTADLWESYEFVHELREYTHQYSIERKQKYETILIAEAYSNLNKTMAYYGNEEYPIAHFPFNFNFIKLHSFLDADSYNDQILLWLNNMPKGATANWVVENHDHSRIGSTLGEEYMDLLTITIMTLPGIACVYYGEEIGMINNIVRQDQRKDILWTLFDRDGGRLPMQWDDTMNAGFTSEHKSWLPVHPNYWKLNVEMQKTDKNSRYNMFKKLSQIRKRRTMKVGDFKPYIVSKWVYAFVRSSKHHEKYIIVLNLGSEIELIDLHSVISDLPANLEVVTASLNAGYFTGDEIRSTPKFPKMFSMRPSSGIVLTTIIRRRSS